MQRLRDQREVARVVGDAALLGRFHAVRDVRVQQRVDRLSNRTAGGAATSSSSSAGQSGGALKFKSLAEAVSAHNQFRRAWQARKMLCMEAVDLLSEGMGKKVKDVMVQQFLTSCLRSL